jgi:hypothetical protein
MEGKTHAKLLTAKAGGDQCALDEVRKVHCAESDLFERPLKSSTSSQRYVVVARKTTEIT